MTGYEEGEGGGDMLLCSVWGCHVMAVGTVQDVNSRKYGDPRCDLHAVRFTGSKEMHVYNCACASCVTSDLNETVA